MFGDCTCSDTEGAKEDDVGSLYKVWYNMVPGAGWRWWDEMNDCLLTGVHFTNNDELT